MDERLTKKERDESVKTQKESMQYQQSKKETSLSRQHKDIVDVEIRKFRRRRLLQLHQEEATFLKDVCIGHSTLYPLRT